MKTTENISGTFLWPNSEPGQSNDKDDLSVFIPNGPLPIAGGQFWACTIENKEGAVVIETIEELERLSQTLHRAIYILKKESSESGV